MSQLLIFHSRIKNALQFCIIEYNSPYRIKEFQGRSREDVWKVFFCLCSRKYCKRKVWLRLYENISLLTLINVQTTVLTFGSHRDRIVVRNQSFENVLMCE